jgi:hypothetical protein
MNTLLFMYFLRNVVNRAFLAIPVSWEALQKSF